MGNETTTSLINYYDDEFDDVIAEAVEQYSNCNIRLRSPNRKAGPTRQKKNSRLEQETY